MRTLVRLVERLLGRPHCRVCGCTEHAACRGGCAWVEPDLCSSCDALDFASLTWTCEVCGARRPDELIEVASTTVGLLTRNVRYCADSDECLIAAHERGAEDARRWGFEVPV